MPRPLVHVVREVPRYMKLVLTPLDLYVLQRGATENSMAPGSPKKRPADRRHDTGAKPPNTRPPRSRTTMMVGPLKRILDTRREKARPCSRLLNRSRQGCWVQRGGSCAPSVHRCSGWRRSELRASLGSLRDEDKAAGDSPGVFGRRKMEYIKSPSADSMLCSLASQVSNSSTVIWSVNRRDSNASSTVCDANLCASSRSRNISSGSVKDCVCRI
mmetsp:Transcript_7877/g.23699  ORF Transcript_7877/g.23699 Transcript_7877/m.23699 type:complete len:215 (+) Transcript_7877:263-907(+)